jgi:hypothetical protein
MSVMAPKKRAYVETYGCQMNISDGELMQGVLEARGYAIVREPRRGRRGAGEHLCHPGTRRAAGAGTCGPAQRAQARAARSGDRGDRVHGAAHGRRAAREGALRRPRHGARRVPEPARGPGRTRERRAPRRLGAGPRGGRRGRGRHERAAPRTPTHRPRPGHGRELPGSRAATHVDRLGLGAHPAGLRPPLHVLHRALRPGTGEEPRARRDLDEVRGIAAEALPR